jgi:hypothetical protein
MNEQAIQRHNPLTSTVVEGEPIHVGERELTPLVRVTTYTRRQAHVGSDRLSGQGWGFVQLRPVAILERSAAGERRIPIRDKTAQMLGGLFLAAFIIPLLLGLAALLMRKRRD